MRAITPALGSLRLNLSSEAIFQPRNILQQPLAG
jgi:hypothetical protein